MAYKRRYRNFISAWRLQQKRNRLVLLSGGHVRGSCSYSKIGVEDKFVNDFITPQHKFELTSSLQASGLRVAKLTVTSPSLKIIHLDRIPSSKRLLDKTRQNSPALATSSDYHV